jgi:hypothetical protein
VTVGELKAKLEMITGGSHLDMKLEVYDDNASVKVCELADDQVPILTKVTKI